MSLILNLFLSRFTSPSSLNLSSYVKWSSPLTAFIALQWILTRSSPIFLLLGSQGDSTLQVWPYQCWGDWKKCSTLPTPLNLLIFLLVQPRISLWYLHGKTILLACVQQELQVLFCKAAFQKVGPHHTLMHKIISPQKSGPCPVELMMFLSGHFSSTSTSLWMAAQPSGRSTTSPSLVSSAKLQKAHCLIL